MKHFEPTKGVGLPSAGYTVLLVAESFTSKRCYVCETRTGEVYTFRTTAYCVHACGCAGLLLGELSLHIFSRGCHSVSGR